MKHEPRASNGRDLKIGQRDIGARPEVNPLPDFDASTLEESIGQRFCKRASENPDGRAVTFDGRTLSYGELDLASNRVARALRQAAGEEKEAVGVLLNESLDVYISMFGVLKAGKVYVPIDAGYPESRISYMLRDSEATVVITDSEHAKLAARLCGDARVLLIDSLDGISTEPVLPLTSQDDLAAICYTSGSTGDPKGVMYRHIHLLYSVTKYRAILGITPADRTASLFSFAFAASVAVVLGAILNGASVFVGKLDRHDGLSKVLKDEKITIAQGVPASLRMLAKSAAAIGGFPALRTFLVGGEPLYKADMDLFRTGFPDSVTVVNCLAMTETGGMVRWFAVHPDTVLTDEVVPVGYGVGDVETLLLDDDLQEVGPGEVGEIAVLSRYHTDGYWKKEALTKKILTADPEGSPRRMYLSGDLGRMRPDGCLLHVGRKDTQVKIRAHRVETSEVEAVLKGSDPVKDVAVIAREDTPGDRRLVAYITVPDGRAVTIGELRRIVSRKLPEYMVPSVFVIMDEMPLNPNGKIDRHGLPAPTRRRPLLESDYVAPRTPVEEAVARLWSDVLRIDGVGVHDNFLELGGQSLLAARVVARAFERFEVELAAQTLLSSPTVAEMALEIARQLAGTLGDDDVDELFDELEEPVNPLD